MLGQLLRFGIVGAANTAVGLAIILVLQNLVGLHPAVSNMAGYIAGFLLGYHFHRTWTFRHSGGAVERAPHYLLTVVACYALNLATLSYLTWIGIDPTVSQIAAVFVYTVSHFILGKWFAFAEKKRPLPDEVR